MTKDSKTIPFYFLCLICVGVILGVSLLNIGLVCLTGAVCFHISNNDVKWVYRHQPLRWLAVYAALHWVWLLACEDNWMLCVIEATFPLRLLMLFLGLTFISRREAQLLLQLLLVLAAVSSVLMIAYSLYGEVIATPNSFWQITFRGAAPFINRTQWTHVISLAFILCCFFANSETAPKSPFSYRWLGFLCCLGLAFSNGRGGTVNVWVALFAALMLMRHRPLVIRYLALAALITALGTVSRFAEFTSVEFTDTLEPGSTSTSIRIALLHLAIRKFELSPWFGHGVQPYDLLGADPHNQYAAHALQFGIFGCILLWLALYKFGQSVLQQTKHYKEMQVIFVVILVSFLFSSFLRNSTASQATIIIIGLLANNSWKGKLTDTPEDL